jgi:tetratricopeptide (TPR) repeat protein
MDILKLFKTEYQDKFPTSQLFELAELLLIDTLAHSITQKSLQQGKASIEEIFTYCHYFTISYLGTKNQIRTLQWPSTIPEQTQEMMDLKFSQRDGDRSDWNVSDVIQIELMNFQHSSFRHRIFLIDENEASIDRDLAPVIERINSLGFQTRSCCSGTLRDHPNTKPYNRRQGYISFAAYERNDQKQNLENISTTPPFEALKYLLEQSFGVVLSILRDITSISFQLRFPVEISDEIICCAWEAVFDFISTHQIAFHDYLIQDSPVEVIYIGNLDKVCPDARDYVTIYQTKLKDASMSLSAHQRSLLLSFLGGHLLNLKEYSKAFDYFQQSLVIDRELHDVTAEAIKLNNIGSVYQELGIKDQALKAFEGSLTLFRQLNLQVPIQKMEQKIRNLNGLDG